MSLRQELLEKYQIRKTKEQKTSFINYASAYAKERGYAVKVEGDKDKVRNIVIGDVGRARVVYTAHYDTPPVMPLPNFITPKCIPIYILYQLALVAVLLAVPMGAALLLRHFVPSLTAGSVPLIVFLVLYYAEMFLMLFGPANKHNANDNTSGVATVLGLADRLAGTGAPVAFILFDCEELGLLGSRLYNKRHRAQMKEKLVVNFDCVSDGDYMMFVGRKDGKAKMPLIGEAFPSAEGVSCLYETRWVVYPSDQNSFPVSVGVASMNKTRAGLLYTNRIHTPRDTVFNERNINFLIDGGARLAKSLGEKDSTPC